MNVLRNKNLKLKTDTLCGKKWGTYCKMRNFPVTILFKM